MSSHDDSIILWEKKIDLANSRNSNSLKVISNLLWYFFQVAYIGENVICTSGFEE